MVAKANNDSPVPSPSVFSLPQKNGRVEQYALQKTIFLLPSPNYMYMTQTTFSKYFQIKSNGKIKARLGVLIWEKD